MLKIDIPTNPENPLPEVSEQAQDALKGVGQPKPYLKALPPREAAPIVLRHGRLVVLVAADLAHYVRGFFPSASAKVISKQHIRFPSEPHKIIAREVVDAKGYRNIVVSIATNNDPPIATVSVNIATTNPGMLDLAEFVVIELLREPPRKPPVAIMLPAFH